MCTQKPPHDFSAQVYERYIALCDEQVAAHVIPPLLAARAGEPLLRELAARWDRHGVMLKWQCRFCNYLDRYYIPRHALPTLRDAAVGSFRDALQREPGLERAIARRRRQHGADRQRAGDA